MEPVITNKEKAEKCESNSASGTCELCSRNYFLPPPINKHDKALIVSEVQPQKSSAIPRILPVCSHTFCQACIEERRIGFSVICPTCDRRRRFVKTQALDINYDLIGAESLPDVKERVDPKLCLYEKPDLEVPVTYRLPESRTASVTLRVKPGQIADCLLDHVCRLSEPYVNNFRYYIQLREKENNNLVQVINSRFLATKTDKNNALANMFMHQVQNLIENNGGEKYIFMEYYDVVPPMEVSGNLDGSLETTPEQQQEQGLDPVERLKLLYPNWGKSPLEICWQQDSQQQNDATSSSELLEQSFDEENGQEEEEEVDSIQNLFLTGKIYLKQDLSQKVPMQGPKVEDDDDEDLDEPVTTRAKCKAVAKRTEENLQDLEWIKGKFRQILNGEYKIPTSTDLGETGVCSHFRHMAWNANAAKVYKLNLNIDPVTGRLRDDVD